VPDPYAAAVPVSRKRKKKPRKSRSSTRLPTGTTQSGSASLPKGAAQSGSTSTAWSGPELGNVLSALIAQRHAREAHRTALVTETAEALFAELVEAAASAGPDSEFEDLLCGRLGARLRELADRPSEDRVGPGQIAEATVTEAAVAVEDALDELDTDPEGWRAPWRVLTTLARILPHPLSTTATDEIEALCTDPGGQVLPKAPDGPAAVGQVLWTRDAYGSRFGVTAAFTTPDGPDRWYLWDIDACGHMAFTVHGAYYPTSEQALAAWQSGVGPVAAARTAFTAVDDAWLLYELLPTDHGMMRPGGESEAQFAEYHRSMALAQATVETVERRLPGPRAHLDAATAATEFAAWLREHRPDLPEKFELPEPIELPEVAEELAESWGPGGVAALYHTCSPHRVALTVLHLHNYYQDEFADQLVLLLPDWISWLAERNGTPAHLAERCHPYARGEIHPDVGSDNSAPNYLARVIE
jgi:hypothetical protein